MVTFVLILNLTLVPSSVVVPGYGSIAECEAAGREAVARRIAMRYHCLTGPVERP